MDGITKSLWEDANINETIKRMNPEDLYRYQKMTNILMGKAVNVKTPGKIDVKMDGVDDSPTIPHDVKIDIATQVLLMLRDGLHPQMLEENERQIYVDVYGLKSLEEYEN